MKETSEHIETGASATLGVVAVAAEQGIPSQRLRETVYEAQVRGAPMVSARAMQARLFDIYDDVSSVPAALALVQHHLRLTLERTWYSDHEIEQIAAELDTLMAAGTVTTSDGPFENFADDADPAPVDGDDVPTTSPR
jgi:hypothetical protein